MYPSPLPVHDPTAVMGKRFGAWIIDALIGGILTMIVLFSFATRHSYGTSLQAERECDRIDTLYPGDYLCVPADTEVFLWHSSDVLLSGLVGLGFWFLNDAVLTGLTGFSIGKGVVGLRVVRQRDGRLCGLGRATARWALWVADGFPYCLGPVTGLIVGLTSKGHRRVGDMVAGTFVVDKRSVGLVPAVPGLTPGVPVPAPGWGAPAPSASPWGPPPHGPGAWPSPPGSPPPGAWAPPTSPAAPAPAPWAPPTPPAAPAPWGIPPSAPPVAPPPSGAGPMWAPPPAPDPTAAPVTAWPPPSPGPPAAPMPGPTDPTLVQPLAAPPTQPVPVVAPGAATPGVDAPLWDDARDTYIQWDPDIARWVQWDERARRWDPI